MPLRAVVDVRVAAPGLRVVAIARRRRAALDVHVMAGFEHDPAIVGEWTMHQASAGSLCPTWKA